MDNPQHYQPLSHALNPSLATGPQYSNFPAGSKNTGKTTEDEEEEDDDEGMVEEQLDLQQPGSNPSSPRGDGQEDQQNIGCVTAFFLDVVYLKLSALQGLLKRMGMSTVSHKLNLMRSLRKMGSRNQAMIQPSRNEGPAVQGARKTRRKTKLHLRSSLLQTTHLMLDFFSHPLSQPM